MELKNLEIQDEIEHRKEQEQAKKFKEFKIPLGLVDLIRPIIRQIQLNAYN